MAYPSGVKTRMVSFGGAATVEAGTPLDIRISTVSSRSLIWVAEGYRLESLAASYQSALEGDEILFEVPTTDQSGWLDAETRQAIIVEPGQASHLYTTTLDIYHASSGARIRTYTIGPYAVPDEPGVLDGDLINPDIDPVSGTLTVYIPGPEGGLSEAGQQAAANAVQAAIDAEGYRDEAEVFSATSVELQDAAVAALIDTPGSDTETQLNAAFVALATGGQGEPGFQLVLAGDASGGFGSGSTNSTPTITLISEQTPHYTAGRGQGAVLRFDSHDPYGKALLVQRLPTRPWEPYHPTTNPMRDAAWFHSHWYHYEEDAEGNPLDNLPIHGHSTWETPDSSGALQTRLEIKLYDPSTFDPDAPKWGADHTYIMNANADLVVRTDSTGQCLRLASNSDQNKIIEWSTSPYGGDTKRWRQVVKAGSDASMVWQRWNGGSLSGVSLALSRTSRQATFGSDTFYPGAVASEWFQSGHSGFYARGTTNDTTSQAAGFRAVMNSQTHPAFAAGVNGAAHDRFMIRTDGRIEWGPGDAARDVAVYRDSSTLRSTVTFSAPTLSATDLRIGDGAVGGGGAGVIRMKNASTVPTSSIPDGGLIYIEAGALKYRGPSGTITTIAPA